jgi:hypothetical protein
VIEAEEWEFKERGKMLIFGAHEVDDNYGHHHD